jgi:hypothetical protein
MSIAAKRVDIGTLGRLCGLWMSVSFFAGSAGVLVGSVALRASGDFRISLAIAGLASLAGFFASMLLPGGNDGFHQPVLSGSCDAQRAVTHARPGNMHFEEVL